MNRRSVVTVFAPGSVGNLICGFDVLGLALERPGDRVTARRREAPGVGLRSVSGDDGRLPRDPARNTASVAAMALLERASGRGRAAAGGTSEPEAGGTRTDDDAPARRGAGVAAAGVDLELDKGLPLSGGMGGSAASAVAAVVAVDALLGLGTEPGTLLACALEGERVAAGSAHADNAAPSLLGGIVLVRPGARRDLVPLPVPPGLAVALLHPRIELPTREARAVLPPTVPLSDAVGQWGDTAALVAGLHAGDWELIADALRDRVAEPVRAGRIPAFAAMRRAALGAGAVGFGISGAGPSVAALCRGVDRAHEVGAALLSAFARETDGEADLHVGRVPERGARVIEEHGSGPS